MALASGIFGEDMNIAIIARIMNAAIRINSFESSDKLFQAFLISAEIFGYSLAP